MIKRYILPSLLILALAASAGIAQSITKALQLSQDASGAFGVDTTNNVYFPGHINTTGNAGPAPTVSSGATTPTISGNDASGLVTMNAAATTATVTFGRAYVSVPRCVVSVNGTVTTTISYVPVTTSIAITASGAVGANNKVTYWCSADS